MFFGVFGRRVKLKYSWISRVGKAGFSGLTFAGMAPAQAAAGQRGITLLAVAEAGFHGGRPYVLRPAFYAATALAASLKIGHFVIFTVVWFCAGGLKTRMRFLACHSFVWPNVERGDCTRHEKNHDLGKLSHYAFYRRRRPASTLNYEVRKWRVGSTEISHIDRAIGHGL